MADGARRQRLRRRPCSTTLGGVARRIYREGVSSERTASARAPDRSARAALREAVERGDAARRGAAARDADRDRPHDEPARACAAARVLADVGGAGARAAARHDPAGAGGAADRELRRRACGPTTASLARPTGVAEAARSPLRVGGAQRRRLARAPAGRAARAKARSRCAGVALPVHLVPGQRSTPRAHLRVYLLKPRRSTSLAVRRNSEDTRRQHAQRGSRGLIYDGEGGPRTLAQVRRVQQRPGAAAGGRRARPAPATRAAIEALLTQHIVRLRVSARRRAARPTSAARTCSRR